METITREPRRPRTAAQLRWAVGTVALFTGAVAIQLTSTFSLTFLWVGTALLLFGWLILPGALWRRILVIIPAIAATWLLRGGPDFTVCSTLLVAAWLLVRHRPPLSYLSVVVPLATGLVLAATIGNFSGHAVALTVSGVSVVAAAWGGWWLSRARVRPPDGLPPQELGQIASRSGTPTR